MTTAPKLGTMQVEVKERVVWVTLNRPPANAVSEQVMEELIQAADFAESNKQVKVMVIGSALQRFFSAGADLSMVNEGRGKPTGVALWHQSLNRIERMSIPTIASINGMALGAGWELSMVCDFRVVARNGAQVGLPEVKVGVFAAGGGTQRMTRLAGRGLALDMVLTGRFLSAEEAFRYGLVSRVVDDADLRKATTELAQQLAALPRPALAASKRCVIEGGELPLAEGLEMEKRLLVEVTKTKDAEEGIKAFLEKRKPNFE
ncbi:MAG: enoyl-CoA hydratase/isomerase family protein [Chloroflexi bacterium]|nr:enoyl-CoA hydratase/isomerase family protein [Chloroflexota bacterium]